MTQFRDSENLDGLVELFSDPNYNPFDVSKALEAVAYGKAVATANDGHIVLIDIRQDRNLVPLSVAA